MNAADPRAFLVHAFCNAFRIHPTDVDHLSDTDLRWALALGGLS